MEELATVSPELSLWKQLWAQNIVHIIIFSVLLMSIIIVMTFKDRLSKNRSLVNALRYGILGVSFVYVGLILKAQPTTTNIVIMINSLRELQFPLGLYLLEPFIFLSFVFIFLTLFLWGRGVFCGWLCPYGAMLELLNKIYEKLFPKLRLNFPDKIHWKLIYLKYFIFFAILGVSFYNFILAEYLTEVEPFRTFVLKLKREWYFLTYFAILTAGSVLIYRAFCRYLCPLGAAMAIPSMIKKIPLIKLKRYDLCSTCKICGRTCRPLAVMSNGMIDSRECLDCLDCQINFWNEDLCPVLIRQKKNSESRVKGPELKGQPQKLLRTMNSEFKTQNLILTPIIITTLLLLSSAVHAKTLSVGTDYSTIGDALKKAKDGDIIEVKGGEYRERIKIGRAVHLKGINNPVVIGQEGYIIEIESRGVTIEGFTIKNDSLSPDARSAGIYISKGADGAVIKNNHLYNVMHGVWSVGAKGVRIENNTIEGIKKLDRNYRGNGIYLTDSQESVIMGNRINYCRDGIYIEVSHDGKVVDNDIRNSRYAVHTMWADRSVFTKNRAFGNLVGIAIMYSRHSTIAENIAAGNQTHGLLLIQAARSHIEGNTVIGNTKGIFFYNSVFNTLASNLIMNNSLGLHNWGGSEDNSVTGNSFIRNEIQVKFIAGRNQKWDGNYWSDYIGWDMTGDGAGDMPYESNTVVDHVLWRYPAAKLLYASSSFQLLWMLEKQFPLMKVPRVVDARPSMLPLHRDWKELMVKYPYIPERYYGEMEKIVH
jgi:nitrous oxidase accessory protein